jgi:hypothetical protein
MYREFKEDRSLLRYCLARFYLSQLSGALRERNSLILAHCARRLICLLPQSIDAFLDRMRGSYLLPSLDAEKELGSDARHYFGKALRGQLRTVGSAADSASKKM